MTRRRDPLVSLRPIRRPARTRTLATKMSRHGVKLYLVRLPSGLTRWVSVPE